MKKRRWLMKKIVNLIKEVEENMTEKMAEEFLFRKSWLIRSWMKQRKP